jgi:phage terminase large subunit-like protein
MVMLKTGIKGLDRYCEQVLSGEIESCIYVKQAVKRHYRDLQAAQSPDFPYYFEPKAAIHFFNFCASLNQYEGQFAGKPIILLPPQLFWFGSIFGWLSKENKTRRYREAYIEMPKKNGKSILGACVALYGLEYDNEPGAQIYSLATNRSHAMKLSYRAAERIIRNTPWLANKYKINRGMATMGIRYEQMDSFFEPLTSKPTSLDGFNVHIFIGDEIKDWTDFSVWHLLADGTITRRQPFALGITTAGSDRGSIGYYKREYLIKVLNQVLTDERFFGIVYSIDEGDEEFWMEEGIWRKANPLYGITVQKEYFEKKVNESAQDAESKVDFMIKHLSVWVHEYKKWMDMDAWNKIGVPGLHLNKFEQQPTYIFLDLSSKQDIASLGVLTRNGKNEQGKERFFYDVINFIPEEIVSKPLTGRKAPYNGWAEAGLLKLTPGNSIDYDMIEDEIEELTKTHKILKCGFDPWNAYHLANNIKKRKIEVVEIPQNPKYLSEPMKTLKSWVLDKQINHNNNPVLTWAMSNVTAREDKNENILPVKEHVDLKIDPAVALINLVMMQLAYPLPNNKQRRKRFGVAKI